MTTTAAPEPGKKINRIDWKWPRARRQRRRCARAAGTMPSQADHRCLLRDGRRRNWSIKLSRIGCSSKSPAYFLGAAHGFNTVHGRMPSVSTGAVLANRKRRLVSAATATPGRSASAVRAPDASQRADDLHHRRQQLLRPDEQFSPTADIGSTTKAAPRTNCSRSTPCSLAIDLGASFVAQSFSRGQAAAGDPQAALSHRGACADRCAVAVRHLQRSRDRPRATPTSRSTKRRSAKISFVPYFDDITIEYEPGRRPVKLHGGSRLYWKKVSEDYNPTDKHAAARACRNRQARRVRHRHSLRRAGEAGPGRPAEYRRQTAGRAAHVARCAAEVGLSWDSWKRIDRTDAETGEPENR